MSDDPMRYLDDAPHTTRPEPDAPVRESLQELTRALAGSASAWDEAAQAEVHGRFDERALDWASRDTEDYRLPLLDALARGEVPHGGTVLEIGSGTGIQTPTLLGHFDRVVALDLSFEMLSRTPAGRGSRVQADASLLPVARASVDAIVCVNAFLFPEEYLRVLTSSGRVVFVSTRAELTPIYLPPEEVLSSLRRADPRFAACSARAAEGCWTVATRG
jgi:ubiquinone/menaquinone biosynthesis C-methylase UbiE